MKVICVCSTVLERVQKAATELRKKQRVLVWEVTDPMSRLPRNADEVLMYADGKEKSVWRGWKARQQRKPPEVWFGS